MPEGVASPSKVENYEILLTLRRELQIVDVEIGAETC